MRIERIAVTLTIVNLVLLVYLLGQASPTARAEDKATNAARELPMLRGRGLEIVDDQGRVRALLAVMPPARVDGKDYPESVLLRLIDPTSGPVVKLDASSDGSGLLLSDDANGGFQILAKDSGNKLNVLDRTGQAQVIEP
jgi:hypothetical protein